MKRVLLPGTLNHIMSFMKDDKVMQIENLQPQHHQQTSLCCTSATTTVGEPMVLAVPMVMEERNATKKRRVDDDDECMLMDFTPSCDTTIVMQDDTENMQVATINEDNNNNNNYLLNLPTEMLAHIFSFLPLNELCHSAEICSTTYAVVRFYTLSVALQVKCREFMIRNEILVKDLIFAQNEHIEVLKKLVEFYRGEIPIPKTEVEKLQLRQAELHLTERTLAAQRDGIQRDIAFYSDQYKACIEVRNCLTNQDVP